MRMKINCEHNDDGAWCTNRKIKRSLCGIGARCCSEYPPGYTPCEHKKPHPKPVIKMMEKNSSAKTINRRDSSTKELGDILKKMHDPAFLRDMGFVGLQRGFVLTIVEPYICKLMSNPETSELVTRVYFRNDHHLVIFVDNEIFRSELGWQKERLRQKINARMKCDMIRRISLYSGKDTRSGIRQDQHG